MKKGLLKNIWPHLIAFVLFIIISLVFFYPQLEGKTINQSDKSNFLGMSKELRDFRQETGEEALWTNSMFGGMPSFLISTYYKGTHIKIFHRILNFLNRPASFFFLSLICFYIGMLIFGVNPWLSIIGAVAFTLSTYYITIIEAGHNSKVQVIAYMAPVIGGVFMTYRRNVWLGISLVGIFLALQVNANHPQITYYTLITILFFVIAELIYNVQQKNLMPFIRKSLLLIIPVVLAVGTNIDRLWSVYEYGEHSMRGESDLTLDEANQTTGLDKDYATAWSYGIDETLTLLIPNFKGGSSHGALDTDSRTYEFLQRNNVPPGQARDIIKQLPLYHGSQPFTSGPFYVGAIIVFLYIMGLFIIRGPIKWWIVAVTVLAISLSWGKNFMGLTSFFMENVPFYNKFRDVKMILVIVDFIFPLMAVLTIHKILKGEIARDELWKALKRSFMIVGGVALLFALFPGIIGDFKGLSDGRLPEWLQESIVEDRRRLLREDAFRSFIFILLGAASIYFFQRKRLRKEYFLLSLGLLITIDMWAVDRRFLNEDDFISRRQAQDPFSASQADKFIMNDPNHPNFRVLNLAVNTFNDASTAYFHHSIGGYHGAKMQRYQELIDFHIQPEMQQLVSTLQNQQDGGQINNVLQSLEVLNMLNTKYIITNPNGRPVQNPHRLGKAWLVEDYRIVDNANEEIEALNDFDPQQTAIIDKQFEEHVQGRNYTYDSSATIQLTHYEPNHLKYDYQASKPQLAVFSEVYYPHGWNAYIDGEEAPHFRVNFILRAMNLPAGEHQIEFRFRPESYYVGGTISGISSILLIAFFVLVIGYEIRNYFKAVSD